MELRLREILKSRSMTLKAFSELSGISQPNLSNYINGNVSPTLEMLNRMADCLEISVTDLLSDKEEMEICVKYKGKMYDISPNDILNIIKSKDYDG